MTNLFKLFYLLEVEFSVSSAHYVNLILFFARHKKRNKTNDFVRFYSQHDEYENSH